MLLSKALQQLATMEQSFSDLYRQLSEAHQEDPEFSGLLFRLSLRKRSHAHLVRYQQRLLRREGDDQRVQPELGDLMEHVTLWLESLAPEVLRRPVPEILDIVIDAEQAARDDIRGPLSASAGSSMRDLSNLLVFDDTRYHDMLMHLRSRRLARAS